MPKRPNKLSRQDSQSVATKDLSRSESSFPPSWAVAIVLAISIFAVYFPARHAPFIFDDVATIEKNSSIRSVWPLISTSVHPGPLNPPSELPTSGRPLVNLTFALNYSFGELDPVGYHVVNIVLHFLTTLLAWAIVRRTLCLPYFAGRYETSAGWLAMAIALLWALHPLQTEAVIYVTQRTELMMAFFYLATFYCGLQYCSQLPQSALEDESGHALTKSQNPQTRNAWLILAIIACSAGMVSKEVMVSAPLMVLLFERTFIAGSLKEAFRRSWPLYAGLAATWLLLLFVNLALPRGESAGFSLGVSAYEWWLTQARVMLMYLKLAVWPSPLLLHYIFPYFATFAAAWIYVVAVLLLAAGVLVLLLRNHPLGFLGTFLFAILSPTMVVPIVTEIAAERRMYLPLLALVVAFVVGVYALVRLVQERSANFRYAYLTMAALSVALAITFGLLSAKRLAAYDNEMQLWREVMEHQPDNYLAHNNLGRLLLNSGQIADALKELQLSVALMPDHYSALNNLGVALDHSGRYKEAIVVLNEALRIDPNSTDALQNLANSLRQVGRLSEAKEKLDKALSLRPDDAEAQNNMGVLLDSSNQTPQAIEHFRLAVQLNPRYAAAHINLGRILSGPGSEQEAIHELQQAVQLEAGRADLHNDLGVILGKNQQNEAAIEQFQIAVRLNPKFAQAYSNLAVSFALINRPADAIAAAQHGIEVGRATDQQEVVKLAEEWLSHYYEEMSRNGPQSK